MPIIEIKSLDMPEIDVYFRLTDPQLRIRPSSDDGLFIAESPKVIRAALETGHRPVSILCERRHICGDASDIIAACPDTPVYTGDREVLASLTGYTLTRGVLAAFHRSSRRAPEEICRDASRVAVIYSVVDATNIGSIFRSAAALGIDAVLLTPDSCDPLNRRAVRVSMGTVFRVPWTWCADPVASLHAAGFRVLALALTPSAIPLDGCAFSPSDRIALMVGTEGDGLPHSAVAASDMAVVIPMSRGVDSLNVGSAAAVAFWHFRHR